MNDYTRENEELDRLCAAHFREYLAISRGIEPFKKVMRCPAAENHKHGDRNPSAIINQDSVYCFSCRRAFHLADLIALDNGLSLQDRELWDKVRDFVGYHRERMPQPMPRPAAPKREPVPKMPEQDLTAYFQRCNRAAHSCEYLLNVRGISHETIDRFLIGFDAAFQYVGKDGRKWKPEPAVIIPTSRTTYKARRINPAPSKDGKIIKVLTAPANAPSIMWRGAAAFRSGKPVFVVEGEMDALSICQAGGEAIALSGLNYKPLLDILPKVCTDFTAPLILMLDGDKPAEKARNEMLSDLAAMKKAGLLPKAFKVRIFTAYPQGCKDANEMLLRYPERFARFVENAERPIDKVLRYARQAGTPIQFIDFSEVKQVV